MEAIKAFLVENDDPLSPIAGLDLKRFEPDLQAPLSLLEYLKQSTDHRPALRSERAAGSFIATIQQPDRLRNFHLTLEQPVEDGLLTASLFEDVFDNTSTKEPKRGLPSLRPDHTDRCQGWAVLTGEDNILIHVKSRFRKANRHLMVIAVNQGALEEGPLMRFIAIDQGYALELDDLSAVTDDSEIRSALSEQVADRLLIFRRKNKDD
ncbi:MAG: hypothetical protein RIC85_05820 [Gammaproteobacteria bacterium]